MTSPVGYLLEFNSVNCFGNIKAVTAVQVEKSNKVQSENESTSLIFFVFTKKKNLSFFGLFFFNMRCFYWSSCALFSICLYYEQSHHVIVSISMKYKCEEKMSFN